MTSQRFLVVLSCVLCFTATTYAHSWVACTDYRGDKNYYDPTQCYGYPRNWGSAAGGSGFGVDTGFNFQGTNTQACRDPLGSAPGYGYSTVYPMARYTPGQQVCLAWPSKNHVAATCTNQYIPDTALEVYALPTNRSDPTQAQFKTGLIKDFTAHVNGVIDFKGFQNCPKFCENMDKSLCGQCFTVPSNLQSGKVYTFQWYWIFNPGSAPYTTCWEAMIGTGSSGSGSGSSTTGRPATTTGRPATTTGRASSTTGRGTTGTVVPPPICGSNTGSGNSGTGLPIGSESVAVSSAPFIIPNSGSFDVIVAYTANGNRLITVDILDTKSNPTWYGKGTASVSAGSGTVSVKVTVGATSPPTGPNYVLRAWSVDSQYASKSDPWTYELSRNDFSVSVGGASAFYAQSAEACADTTPCAELCGGADQVATCDCDETGHVSVLCNNTPAPIADSVTAAAGVALSHPFVLLAALAATTLSVLLL